MKRRIIKQKTAYTLTLPISWIRDHNLEGKDEVEVEEEHDVLVIKTQKKSKTETIAIQLEQGTAEYYRIMVENLYLKGYDVLDITYKDEKAFQIIQQIVSNLIGFEVVNQAENSCVIAETAQSSPEQFTTLLNRCFNIITFTQDTIKQDLSTTTFPHFAKIDGLTKDARRFLLFCTRAIHKISITTRREESFLHLLLERLILIQHSHFHIYKKIHALKNLKIREKIKDLYSKTCEMFNIFKNMFYKKDLRYFVTINNYWDEIYFHEGHNLFEGCTKEESIIIYHSLYLSKLIFLISQPNITQLKTKF